VSGLEDLVRTQYVARQLLTRRAVRATRKAWATIDPKAIRATWHAHAGPTVVRIVTGAQHEAAAAADGNVTAALTVQGHRDDPAGRIHPAAFAGAASDGRDLATLLELSNVYALQQISGGATPTDALGVAGRWLATTVATQVIDAGRAATSVAITARSHVTGFIRVLNPPSCARCAILGGNWYRWNADFERHVSCDCSQIPAAEDATGDIRTDPMALFRAGQISDLSAADTQAIRDGADISQVVNAHRGMYTAGGRSLTREGVTARGRAGQRIRELGSSYTKIPRLTPEQIYRDTTSRAQAIELLHRFGYIA
jgi:hypothetical protein